MVTDTEIKQQVREFYDQVGWQEVSDGIYQNATYEDLRPVAREYIHHCHLRVTAPSETQLGTCCWMPAQDQSNTLNTWNIPKATSTGFVRISPSSRCRKPASASGVTGCSWLRYCQPAFQSQCL